MANSTNKQIASGIAALVRGQRFSGSGVWRQSGNATLRIQTQTEAIVNALSRIPSIETQEEEERESDKQHAELIDALRGDGASSPSQKVEESSKKKGLLGAASAGIMGTKGLVGGLGNIIKRLSSPFKKGGTLAKILGGFVGGVAGIGSLIPKGLMAAIRFFFKGLRFLGFGAIGLAIAGFLTLDEKTQQEYIDKFFNVVNAVGNFFKTISKQFTTSFMTEFEKVGGNEELDRLGKAWNNFTGKVGEQADGLLDYVSKIEVKFDGKVYTGKQLAEFFGVVSARTSKNLISFAAATLEYLADPEMAIKDLKKVITTAIDDFGYSFTELFSKAGLVRMLESYGLGVLVSKNFRQEAANEQMIRALRSGRDLLPSDTVEREMSASDFGAFSAPSLIGEGYNIYSRYVNTLFRDTGRIIQMGNEGMKNLILGDNFGGDPLAGVGTVIDNSTAINQENLIINRLLNSRGEKVVGEEKPIGK